MDLYNISFLLLFLADFETVTGIFRTEMNVMLCMPFTASSHWLLRKHVWLTCCTIWLIISTSQINPPLEGSVLKHCGTEHSGQRGIKKGCVDFLSTTQQLNHRLSRSGQHLTTNRVGVGGKKNTFAFLSQHKNTKLMHCFRMQAMLRAAPRGNTHCSTDSS